MTTEAKDQGRVQVLERALDLLALLAKGPKTLTQVVRESGLPKGTVFRLLAALGYRELVSKDPVENRYMLGPGFLRLVQGAVEGLGAMATPARDALVALRDTTRETVVLHVRVGTARVCVEEIPSPEAIRYTAGVGSVAPLHVGAASRVLLAFMEEEACERVLDRLTLTPLTENTIVDPGRLREEIARVRERGWATSAGERVPGAAALSVPVRGAQGALLALSVLGPADRWTPERQRAVLDELRSAARTLTRVLGGDDPGEEGGAT
jgi:DNA-binding IclR family transcriptional regulator